MFSSVCTVVCSIRSGYGTVRVVLQYSHAHVYHVGSHPIAPYAHVQYHTGYCSATVREDHFFLQYRILPQPPPPLPNRAQPPARRPLELLPMPARADHARVRAHPALSQTVARISLPDVPDQNVRPMPLRLVRGNDVALSMTRVGDVSPINSV